MRKNILIVGCGVSGLTCGIRLLEEGFSVRIVAEILPPYTTSNVAAAYWYPYSASHMEKGLQWAEFSFNIFLELIDQKETGISMIELVKLFDHKVEYPSLKNIVHNFRHAGSSELPGGYLDGYIMDVPLIETPVYMQYLINRFRGNGGNIEKTNGEIASLDDICSPEQVIVNCPGLGSHDLCKDEKSYPIRGQIVRTTNPGIRRIINDESGPLSLSYIVPRSNDCILGGTAQENDWDLNVNSDTANEILRKCTILEPKLKEAKVLEHKVGLRPGREQVRLETEELYNGCTVIHNYGHGRAGFTLSWGCAGEVVQLVKTICT